MNALIDIGAWIVAVYKVLSQYNTDDPALDDLEAIITAGRTAELFSAVRSLGVIDHEKFEAHRKLAGLRPSNARRVLQIAVTKGDAYVDWSDDQPPVVKQFCFLRDSNDAVLEAAGSVFENLDSTPVARAVIEILRTTITAPRNVDTVTANVVHAGIQESAVTQALNLVCALRLTSTTEETQDGSQLIFNPYVFETGVVDVVRTLDSLDETERQHAQDILQYIQEQPGVPLPQNTDRRVLQVLIRIGLVDYSKITTIAGTTPAYFATAPQTWGVLAETGGPPLSKDLIDDSKLFLNSLRYGEYYSDPIRGKIKNAYWIVNALLRDGEIGVEKPVRAIGEDYPLVWSRGIINVVESRLHPGRYSMELRKRDIATAVRDVLLAQRILPTPKAHTAEAVEKARKFISPGAVRVEKELPPELKRYHDELVFGLRTLRKGR